MAKKNMSNGSILLNLYHNKILVSKVDEALDEGKSYDYIVDFCKEKYDFNISKSALTRYNKKRKEAQETGQDLEDLLDKRRKTGKVVDIQNKEVTNGTPVEDVDKAVDSVETLYNDVELLDEIIQKGFNGVKYVDVIELGSTLKAIELKDKITRNQLQGVSLVGLRQLRLRQSAKEQAMTDVIMQFIPEEQHEEVYKAIEESEEEFYKNLDLTEENKRISKALNQAGMDII